MSLWTIMSKVRIEAFMWVCRGVWILSFTAVYSVCVGLLQEYAHK